MRTSALGALAAGLLVVRAAAAAPPGPEAAPPAQLVTGAVPAAVPAAVAVAASEVTISASEQWTEGKLVKARGFVDVRYRDTVLQADLVSIDRDTMDVVAEGQVVLQQGEQRLVGEWLNYNLDTELGEMDEGWGYAPTDVFFQARSVEKVGPREFELQGATMTSCTQPRPIWRFKASRVRYEVNRWVKLSNVRLELFGVPILYLPYFQYPAKRGRATGFLIPSVGTNNTYGFYVTNGFFLALGRSYDLTVMDEYYTTRGHTIRGEFNYLPSAEAVGSLRTQNAFDRLTNTVHSAYSLSHNQRLGETWRLTGNVDYATDDALDREFSRSLARITQVSRNSNIFLARYWSRFSLAVGGNYGQLLGQSETSDLRLPVIDFAVRDFNLFGPAYGALTFGAVRFQRTVAGGEPLSYERVDVDPRFSIPLAPFPWLQVEPLVEYKITNFSKSYEPGPTPGARTVSEDDFLRRIGYFSLNLRGPIFTRVFQTPGNFYSEKFKHVIEPSFALFYVNDFDPEGRAFLQANDRVDRPGFFPGKGLSIGLRNGLAAKRSPVPGALPVPYEFLSLELGMGVSLDPMVEKRRGPVDGRLRFVPASAIETSFDFSYDTYDTFFSRQSLHVILRGTGRYTDITYARSRDLTTVSGEELRGYQSFDFGGRLQLGASFTYNLKGHELRQFSSNLIYKTQCCGIGFAYGRFNLGSRNDSEYRVGITFKNVGTVFDYAFGDHRL